MRTRPETVEQIATRLGISRQALHYRLRKGWDPVRAVTLPKAARNPQYEGQETLKSKCAAAGIPLNTYYSRIKRGLTPEEALQVSERQRSRRRKGMTVLSNLTPDPTLTPRIHAAIDATKASAPEYWERCCAQRDSRSPDAAGSVLTVRPGYTGSIEDMLRAAEWSEYQHEAVIPAARAFRTFDMQGRMGLVALSSLEPDTTIVLADPKGTGKAEATVRRERGETVQFVTIILGPLQDGTGECVWTFHPGPPISPSTIDTPPEGEREITAAQAIALGLAWAKCVG